MALRAARRSNQTVAYPAPTRGLDMLAPLMNFPAENCVSLVNFVPREYGIEVRPGFQEFATGFTGASTGPRTIIPYHGEAADGSKDALFVATQEGVYNVTSGTPALVVTWGTHTGKAGYCSYTSFSTIGGKFLIVCDEENGTYMYTESSSTWEKAVASAPGTGEYVLTNTGATADPADFVFVASWKNRLFFVQRDSGVAYFLPVGSVQGTTLEYFEFGTKFSSGGFLNSIHSFSVDAGAGVDDYLVALSSQGDLLVYKGANPSGTTMDDFYMSGVWQIGKLPAGRNVAAQSGGDLFILSSLGVSSVAQLLQGVDAGVLPAYITGGVTPLVRKDLLAYGSVDGWALVNHTAQGVLLILMPPTTGASQTFTQYAMNMSTRAWAKWTGVPMDSAAVWRSTLYFGNLNATTQGRVLALAGHKDEDAAIRSFVLTPFRGAGEQIAPQRVHMAEAFFYAEARPNWDLEARYDFDISEEFKPVPGANVTTGATTWGVSTWGTATWPVEVLRPSTGIAGTWGMGKFAALALTVKSIYRTTLVGFAVTVDVGNAL